MQDLVIQVEGISKHYDIFDRPQDRLKQALTLRLHRFAKPFTRLAAPRYSRTFTALNNVSFDVSRGEALGILGRNGAGKSTLLQIIAGTLSPSSGRVTVRGKVAALLELGSGFSPDFTGRENVRLSASLLGLDDRQIDERFDAIARFADIGDFIEQPVKTYSTGMVLRLAFAVQTAIEPDVFIVDEALAVGDARFQKKCFDRLDALRKRGTTILFVTHDTGTIVQFCNRALILEKGCIVSEGDPHRVAREYHRLLFDVPAAAAKPAEALAPAKRGEETRQVGDEESRESGMVEATLSSHSDAADREVRYGSNDVEICAVTVLDRDGLETRVVDIHQEVVFRFVAVFHKDISNPVAYGFSIANAKGVELYATKSQMFERRLPPSPAGSRYECRLVVKIPFVAGTYFLTAALAHDDDRPRGEFLDYRFDALQFQVVGRAACFTTCVMDLEARLDHQRLPVTEANAERKPIAHAQ